MQPAIRTDGLTKTYGKSRGIVDLDLEVERGEVFGFLGPNGAGKTTTIRLLLDLIRPTLGRAAVLGLDPRSDGVAVRGRLGYLPGELALWQNATGAELLTFSAAMRKVRDLSYAHGLVERLGIDMSRKTGELSKGNRQKVGVLLALFHRPELLVLDEPTGGLDPLVQKVVHELFREAREEGRTVFLSSHVLSEVQQVADRVGIVREGTMVAVESISSLRKRALRHIEIEYAHPVPPDAFEHVGGVREARIDGSSVRLSVEGPMDAALRAVVRFPIETLASHEADLEDIFLSYYETEGDDAAR